MKLVRFLPVIFLAFASLGCQVVAAMVDGDIDGYYNGWLDFHRPVCGFSSSAHATLKVCKFGSYALLKVEGADIYRSYDLDFDSWSQRMRAYFRIREVRWDPVCGYEEYRWTVILNGDVYYGEFEGNIIVDIDPCDYKSDYCYMDYDPSPKIVGDFDLDYDSHSLYYINDKDGYYY
ncbi:MAG: hypothetical protein ABIC40_04730 [bacterium]